MSHPHFCHISKIEFSSREFPLSSVCRQIIVNGKSNNVVVRGADDKFETRWKLQVRERRLKKRLNLSPPAL